MFKGKRTAVFTQVFAIQFLFSKFSCEVATYRHDLPFALLPVVIFCCVLFQAGYCLQVQPSMRSLQQSYFFHRIERGCYNNDITTLCDDH